jgi:acetoin utilization deacetylase AcuC-like enzyme
MEFTLINGRFSTSQTELLLKQLVKVKTDFHMENIDNITHSEEQIKHSERRIKELEESLRTTLALLQEGGYKAAAVRATVHIELVPDYHN